MNGKDRRYLRGLAHALNPLVIIGRRGLTDGVVRQVDQALTDHELIKVRVAGEAPVHRDEASALLAQRTGCEVAGTIGRIMILYRRHPEQPKIVLPDGTAGKEE